jgi:hypothetical protein
LGEPLYFAAPEDAPMRDAYEVLRETEQSILRVRKEIEALLVVAPLLKDEGDQVEDDTPVFAVRA